MTFTIAFTGHRPAKLGGYGDANPKRRLFKTGLAYHLDELCRAAGIA